MSDLDDADWTLRARLGRAFGIWSGGLDGPPPNIEELEAWAVDAARLRDVDALRRLREAVARLDATPGSDALNALHFVVERAREVSRG